MAKLLRKIENGDQLRTFRIKLGLTQTQLAEKMGYKIMSIYLKEKGKRKITERDRIILNQINNDKRRTN